MIVDSKGYPNDILKNYFNFNHHRCFTKKTLEYFLGINGWKKKYINYSNSYGNLKLNRKMYNKKTKLKSNKKGNIIGILTKQEKKQKISFETDKLFTAINLK